MLLLQGDKGFDRLRAIGVEHDEVIADDKSDLVFGMRGPVIMERFGAQSVEPRIPFDRGLLLPRNDRDYIQSIAVPVKCGALSSPQSLCDLHKIYLTQNEWKRRRKDALRAVLRVRKSWVGADAEGRSEDHI
jgi:hypothetical protein